MEKYEIGGLKIRLGEESKISYIDSRESTHKSFVWTANDETIKYIVGAIDNLLTKDKAGHYYLHEDAADGIILEMAYNEYITIR